MTTPTTFFPRTIIVLNTSPQQIWNANTGARPLITVPNSGNFILYIGPKTALLKQDYGSCLSFLTGMSMSFDDVEIWAISTAPGGITVSITPDGSDYNPQMLESVDAYGQTSDTIVETTGTLQGNAPTGTYLVNGGATAGFSGFSADTAYHIAIDAQALSATPVTPFYKVSIIFQDLNRNNVFIRHHCFLMTNVNPAVDNIQIGMCGPMMTPFYTVNIKNYDTSGMYLDFEMSTNQEPLTEHFFAHNSDNILNSFTYMGFTFATPTSNPPIKDLGSTSGINLPSTGAVESRINAAWGGRAELTIFSDSGQSGNQIQFGLYYVDPDQAGGISPDPVPFIDGGELTVPNNGQCTLYKQDYTLPNAPTILNLNSIGGIASVIGYHLIREDRTT